MRNLKSMIGITILALVVALMSSYASTASELEASRPTNTSESVVLRLPELFVQLKHDAIEADFSDIAAIGFDGVRVGLRWDIVERNGVYDWTYFNRTLDLAIKYNLDVLVTLRGGNEEYTSTVAHYTESVGKVEHLPSAPMNKHSIEAFSNFAAAAVNNWRNHAPTTRVTWEIWNEPDFSRFWPPQPNAEHLADLLLATCPAMRAAGAEKVIGPALGKRESTLAGSDFLSALGSHRALDCLDGLSIHPYWCRDLPCFSEDVTGVGIFLGTLRSDGTRMPIYFTEWGVPSVNGSPSEEERALLILTGLLSAAINQVNILSIYEWRDSGDDPGDREHTFGINTADRLPKHTRSVLQQFVRIAPYLKVGASTHGGADIVSVEIDLRGAPAEEVAVLSNLLGPAVRLDSGDCHTWPRIILEPGNHLLLANNGHVIPDEAEVTRCKHP